MDGPSVPKRYSTTAAALVKSVGHPGTQGLPLFFWVHVPFMPDKLRPCVI